MTCLLQAKQITIYLFLFMNYIGQSQISPISFWSGKSSNISLKEIKLHWSKHFYRSWPSVEYNLVKVTHFFHIFLEKFIKLKSYTWHFFFFVNIWTASSKLVTKSGFYVKNCSVTNVTGGKLNKEYFLNALKVW